MGRKIDRICLILPLLVFSVSCASHSGTVKRASYGIQVQAETSQKTGEYRSGEPDRQAEIAPNDKAKNPYRQSREEEIPGPWEEAEVPQGTADEDSIIERELRRLMREFGEDSGEVPPVFLREVKGYIRLFQTDPGHRKFVASTLTRSPKYMPMIKDVLKRKGIPQDMAYIAFIESGFNPHARSHAGAVGMWQFMPQTGRDYSLRVSRWTDERKDPVKSTYSASEYFHDLLAIFGTRSFLLAMAAYNAGEGRVISCLKKIDDPQKERNFWQIRSCLAKETREYPPKIVAAAIIGNNPEAFGFGAYKPDKNEVLTAKVLVEKANKHRVSGKAAKKRIVRKAVKKVSEVKPLIFRVKKGGSIFLIAEAFRVRSSDIRRWNKLRGDTIYAGQKLKIYPRSHMEKVKYKVRRGDTISEIAEGHKVRQGMILVCNSIPDIRSIRAGQVLTFYTKAKKKPVTYTVKRGTNLTSISRAYRVSVKDIMEWNNLRSTTIYPGQRLKIYPGDTRSI